MPDTIWNELVAAHQRYEHEPAETMPTHRPRAAVLACSDARVPPSVVFDQPAGALFVIRIAGNTASPAALASLDYAVAELGVDLVVVLGHTGCGAVQAAMSGNCGGHLAPIVAPICQIAATHPGAAADELARRNIDATVDALTHHPGPVGSAARAGSVQIRGAIHDLLTGRLEPLDRTDPRTTDEPIPEPSPLETP